jgi:hypothetical protein
MAANIAKNPAKKQKSAIFRAFLLRKVNFKVNYGHFKVSYAEILYLCRHDRNEEWNSPKIQQTL